MLKHIIFAAAAILASFSAPAFADTDPFSVVFDGHQIHVGGQHHLTTFVDGQPALTDVVTQGGTIGDYLSGEYLVQGKVFVLIDETRQGIACDQYFQAIEIDGSETHTSRQFGDCGYPEIKKTPTSVIVNFDDETDIISASGIETKKHAHENVEHNAQY